MKIPDSIAKQATITITLTSLPKDFDHEAAIDARNKIYDDLCKCRGNDGSCGARIPAMRDLFTRIGLPSADIEELLSNDTTNLRIEVESWWTCATLLQ